MANLFVLTNEVRTELDNVNIPNLSSSINETFDAVSTFNESWHDDKNSNNFISVVQQYQKKVNTFLEDLSDFKTDIIADMDRYDEIEKRSESWE